MSRRFDWDPAKNASNKRKHGVSFELATRVFGDPLLRSDINRIVGEEERWLTIGAVGGVLLVVAHTYGVDDDGTEVIRIISARKAGPAERRRHEQ